MCRHSSPNRVAHFIAPILISRSRVRDLGLANNGRIDVLCPESMPADHASSVPREATRRPGILALLQHRELQQQHHLENKDIFFAAKATPSKTTDAITDRMNSDFCQVSTSIKDLSLAIESRDWVEVERAIAHLLNRLIDSSSSESVYSVSPKRKQEREMFVALGGLR